MTDERQGDALFPAIGALPRGSGIIFRHYSLNTSARKILFHRVRLLARRYGHMLLLAGQPKQALAWKADGFHGRYHNSRQNRTVHTAPAHNITELVAARRCGAELIFLSPVYATSSHPGQKTLGTIGFGILAKKAGYPIIALGGMTAKRGVSLKKFGIHGWAAIDALTPKQIRI